MNSFGLLVLLTVVMLFYGVNKCNVAAVTPPFVNPIDPCCNTSNVKCKEKPTVGVCLAKDPTNNPLSAKAGKYKVCCPVWECTDPNGEITEHWGMTGGKKKSSNSSSNSSAAGRSMQMGRGIGIGERPIKIANAVNTTTDSSANTSNVVAQEETSTKMTTTTAAETTTVLTTTTAPSTTSTINTAITSKSKNPKFRPSTNSAPQCKQAQCFPPPSGQVCTAGHIKDCSVLVVLGPLAGCCSAYSCPNSTSDNLVDTHFGLTDGTSEVVLNYGQTLEESKKPTPNCEAAMENPPSTESPSVDSSKGDMSGKPPPRIMYIDSCSSISCIPPPNVNLTKCQKYDDWLTGKLVSLGVTKTCCPVWLCTQNDASVTNDFGVDAESVDSEEGIAIPLQLNQTTNPDDENIPKQVLPKGKSYSKCPKVKCTPPIVKGMCKVSKSSSSVKSGPLRKSKECCPMWECSLENGGHLNVYGRTTTDEADLVFGDQKQTESIFQQMQANAGEEEISETDFQDTNGMRGHTKTFKKKWSATALTGASNKLSSNTLMTQSAKNEMGYGQPFNPPKGWNQFGDSGGPARQSMIAMESYEKTRKIVQGPNEAPTKALNNTSTTGSSSPLPPEPMQLARQPAGTGYPPPAGGQGAEFPAPPAGFPAQGGRLPPPPELAPLGMPQWMVDQQQQALQLPPLPQIPQMPQMPQMPLLG